MPLLRANKKKKDSERETTKKGAALNNKAVVDYNPRWKGYCYIALASLINFISIADIAADKDVQGSWGFSLSFGIVFFVWSFAVLLTDRLKLGTEVFDYTKAKDGKVEGYCLLVMTAYSIVGVAYITQVRGIAYSVLNVYFSSWLTTISCLYTLNKWSTAKDILSFRELTGVSATLKSWYILFVSSMVVTGTSINMIVALGNSYTISLRNDSSRAAAFGSAFGFSSTVISLVFILTHYNFIERLTEGGWVELFCIVLVNLMWIIGTAVLTQDGGIAATISGTGCRPKTGEEPALVQLILSAYQDAASQGLEPDCVVTILNATYSCGEFWNPPLRVEGKQLGTVNNSIIPGSNLYVFVWICLLSSVNLVSRWKAQQALQFAQAQQEKAFQQAIQQDKEKAAVDGDSDDLDDFEDAEDDE